MWFHFNAVNWLVLINCMCPKANFLLTNWKRQEEEWVDYCVNLRKSYSEGRRTENCVWFMWCYHLWLFLEHSYHINWEISEYDHYWSAQWLQEIFYIHFKNSGCFTSTMQISMNSVGDRWFPYINIVLAHPLLKVTKMCLLQIPYLWQHVTFWEQLNDYSWNLILVSFYKNCSQCSIWLNSEKIWGILHKT
jgi:hypothetical protein